MLYELLGWTVRFTNIWVSCFYSYVKCVLEDVTLYLACKMNRAGGLSDKVMSSNISFCNLKCVSCCCMRLHTFGHIDVTSSYNLHTVLFHNFLSKVSCIIVFLMFNQGFMFSSASKCLHCRVPEWEISTCLMCNLHIGTYFFK